MTSFANEDFYTCEKMFNIQHFLQLRHNYYQQRQVGL